MKYWSMLLHFFIMGQDWPRPILAYASLAPLNSASLAPHDGS